MNARIVVVDDEALVRASLRAVIEAEPGLTVVGEAAGFPEALGLVRRARPDLVLMDVRMPGVDGVEATRRILRAVARPPRIVLLTAFPDGGYLAGALQAGACGYLLKRARPEEIVQTLRLVALGGADCLVLPAAVRDLVAQHTAACPPERTRNCPAKAVPAGPERLTDREHRVLLLMAAGLSNAEIAAELFVSLQTVKTHVGKVLTKLGARDRTQAVIAAYESGLVGAAAARARPREDRRPYGG